MLSPEIQSEILSLYFSKKMKIRAITRLLGVDRKSVKRLLRRDSIQIRTTPSKRASLLDPYRERILTLLREDPTTTNAVIFHRLRDEGYVGGRTILRDWLSTQRPHFARKREGFFKLEFQAGEVAQVDWGELGDVVRDGVKIHCFVMVLCYSRLLCVFEDEFGDLTSGSVFPSICHLISPSIKLRFKIQKIRECSIVEEVHLDVLHAIFDPTFLIPTGWVTRVWPDVVMPHIGKESGIEPN